MATRQEFCDETEEACLTTEKPKISISLIIEKINKHSSFFDFEETPTEEGAIYERDLRCNPGSRKV